MHVQRAFFIALTSLLISIPCVTGCGDGASTTTSSGGAGAAGTGGTGGSAGSTGGSAGNIGKPSVAHGQYIAEALGPCGQCHTPKDAMGMPDDTKHYGGSDCFIDIDPMDDAVGCLATPNLTNHETGLKNRSDAEIKEMITNGKRPDGSAMFPFMPYFVVHTLNDVDIDSIILYLRTLPPIDHAVAKSQPPFDVPIPMPAPALTEAEMPMPTTVNDATMRGRYLGVYACMQCHTPLTEPTDFRSLDKTKLFAGGNTFISSVLGYPSPPLPAIVYSTNLTSDAMTGLGYTKDQLLDLLKTGKDKNGKGYCPPMPIMNAYGKMTPEDMSDIADYILALPAVSNTLPNGCEAP